VAETARFIAIDPGLMTGLSVWEWDRVGDPALMWSGEVDYDHFASSVRSWYDLSDRDSMYLNVICERFVINAATAKKSQAPYSLELIGQLKLIMMDHEVSPETIAYQSPSDAMAMFDNKKLKKLDYWHVGGAGHALDSIRHGLLYFVKRGWKPAGLLS